MHSELLTPSLSITSPRSRWSIVPNCQNCEAFVTADFARVFGDNEGEVYRCTECTSFRELISGKTARPEP